MSLFPSSTALTAPMVAIDTAGSATAGELLTLTCRVIVVEDLTVQPDVEWVVPGGSAVMSAVNNVTVVNVSRNGRESALDLEFSPLQTFHGGQYTCRAIIDIQSINVTGLSGSSSQNVTVQSKHCNEFDACKFMRWFLFSSPPTIGDGLSQSEWLSLCWHSSHTHLHHNTEPVCGRWRGGEHSVDRTSHDTTEQWAPNKHHQCSGLLTTLCQ